MSQRESFLALALLLLVVGANAFPVAAAEASAATPGSGSCEHSTESETTTPTPGVDVPNYAVESVDMPDSREQAREEAWKAYQKSLFDSLSHSSDPRDWVLAALLQPLQFYLDPTGQDTAASEALLERAVRAAPDDVLVQWIAARASRSSEAPSALAISATQRLKQLEPDNAAVLLEELAVPVRHGNATEVDAVLARMSARASYDEHLVDILKIALRAYRRYPVPADYWQFATTEEKDSPPEAFAFASALSVSVAVGGLSYQHLVEACRSNGVSRVQGNRAADCAALGHLMVTHGGTILANRIGYTVLRVSGTYTESDVAAARDDDWLYSKEVGALKAGNTAENAESIAAYEHDWLEAGNEFDAIRGKLSRLGVPTKPPQDWLDEHGMFSAERLRADAAHFEQHPQSNGSH